MYALRGQVHRKYLRSDSGSYSVHPKIKKLSRSPHMLNQNLSCGFASRWQVHEFKRLPLVGDPFGRGPLQRTTKLGRPLRGVRSQTGSKVGWPHPKGFKYPTFAKVWPKNIRQLQMSHIRMCDMRYCHAWFILGGVCARVR